MIRYTASAVVLGIAVSVALHGPEISSAAVIDAAGTAATVSERHTLSPSGRYRDERADRRLDAAALEALTAGDDADALSVSPGFVERFGYAPRWRDSMALRPDGSCSSPIPLPDSFRLPCAAHDFGYDLLRRVDSTDPGVRRKLDSTLVGRLDTQCSLPAPPTGTRSGCRGLTAVVAAALAVNTWRQDGKPPFPESITDILVSLVRKVVPA